MTPRRVALLLLVAVAALLAVPVGAGSARTSLDAVAASLTATPVYNDTSAERAMTSAETQALIADVRETGLPYFIAVLPASTLDTQYPTPNDVLAALPDKVNRPGIYAVVVGNDFRAGSTRSPTVTDLADAAIKEYRGAGTYAVLQGFVAAAQCRHPFPRRIPPVSPGSSPSCSGPVSPEAGCSSTAVVRRTSSAEPGNCATSPGSSRKTSPNTGSG